MPFEIGEIGVSLKVSEEAQGARRKATATDPCTSEEEHEQREDLIDECVRRVLAALRTQQVR